MQSGDSFINIFFASIIRLLFAKQLLTIAPLCFHQNLPQNLSSSRSKSNLELHTSFMHSLCGILLLSITYPRVNNHARGNSYWGKWYVLQYIETSHVCVIMGKNREMIHFKSVAHTNWLPEMCWMSTNEYKWDVWH